MQTRIIAWINKSPKLVSQVVDSVVEESRREARQHSVRAVVGVESRAAVPHFLPGEVQKGGVAPWTEHQSCQVGERFRDLRFWENTTEAFLGLPY